MTTLQLPTPLVDVAWLAAHLADPRLVVLDAHMAPPGSAPVAGPVMQIPGARRFDFDSDIRDQRSPLPHMLPSAEQFTALKSSYINWLQFVFVSVPHGVPHGERCSAQCSALLWTREIRRSLGAVPPSRSDPDKIFRPVLARVVARPNAPAYWWKNLSITSAFHCPPNAPRTGSKTRLIRP